MQNLGNPAWISIIIAALSGIVLPIVYFLVQRRNRKVKQFSMEIISYLPGVYVAGEVMGKVKVTFNNQPTHDIGTMYMKVQNTGNEPIDMADYAGNSQIKFNFGGQTEVLEAEVTETSPKSIKQAINIATSSNPGYVIINPFLLKSQESVTLKVLVSGFENEISDETRLIGAKQTIKAKIHSLPSMRNIGFSFAILMIIAPFLFINSSRVIFNFFNITLASYSESGLSRFYYTDLIGSIILAFIIFITYFIIFNSLPSYILSNSQYINLTKYQKKSKKNFVIIACLLILLSPTLYYLITISISAYQIRALQIYNYIGYAFNALNASDTIGSVITTVILIIMIYLLDKYLPLRVPIKKEQIY